LGFPGHQPSLTLDLVAEIRELRKEINALKQKVANLEQS
jgi:cell division protein FtsB